MTTLRQAAQQALEALGKINKLSVGENAICLPAEIDGAMDALRAALAEPAQEPRTIRMERVDRSTSQHWWSEAARIRMPSPELYAAGDTVLCWVNEGDMVRAAQPKAEPVQEPYGWIGENSGQFIKNVGQGIVNGKALYTAPPQRKPLTEKQIDYWIGSNSTKKALARAIEAAHGIGEKHE